MKAKKGQEMDVSMTIKLFRYNYSRDLMRIENYNNSGLFTKRSKNGLHYNKYIINLFYLKIT